jgi:hypothetical protein
VTFPVAAKSPRWQSTIAIVAALALFLAAMGCWVLRSELVAAATPHQAAVSHSTADIRPVHVSEGSKPASHLEQISLPTNKTSFKSAGLKRNRPPTWSLSTPQLSWSPWSASLAAWGDTAERRLGVGCSDVPVAAVAGQELLTQLCVARR